jgi:hypothetical protein
MSTQTLAKLLRTFPYTRFHPEAHLLTWHPRGVLDDAFADEIVAFVETEALAEVAPFNRFTDLSGITIIQLAIGHVFRIAERRRDACEPVKSAFFAATIVGFGIAHLYEELMKGGLIDVRAFRERTAAAEWLGVPTTILESD